MYFEVFPKVDEDLMNKILWAYILRKKTIESPSTWTFIAAKTGLFDHEDVEIKFQNDGVSSNSRQQTYPPYGKLELFQSWTGEPLHDYRGNLVLPQTTTFYKYPQLCLLCLGERKEAGKGWDNRTKLFVHQLHVPVSLDTLLSVYLLMNQVFLFEVYAKMQ